MVAIPKIAVEDTSLVIQDNVGDPHTFPVPAGAVIMLNAAGMQRNRASI